MEKRNYNIAIINNYNIEAKLWSLYAITAEGKLECSCAK